MSEGRFTIQQVLGAGAYAVVCVAHDASLGHTVALKIPRLAAQRDLGALERLRDEGRILTELQHPNIASAYEVLDYDGLPVLVMEHVQGSSLEDVCDRHGPLPTPLAIQMVGQAAMGLEFAWSGSGADGLHIVHRDIKPANVLLATDGTIRIIDFGIAKGSFKGREAKSVFVVQGSAGFDAPERSQDTHQDDQAVDVYSLGALFLVLLTGHEPVFSRRADRHAAGLERHLAQVQPHDSLNNDALKELIGKMLSHNPKERPAMAVVIARLRELLQVAQVSPDVAAFAAAHVQSPEAEYRAAQDDPLWEEVRFVASAAPTTKRETLPVPAAARAMRNLIKGTAWERDLTQLRSILERSDRFVARPLIDVLDRAEVPWFKPWVSCARPGELEAALILLCDHADERVTHRAQLLSGHDDPRVAAAARFVLAHNPPGRQAYSS